MNIKITSANLICMDWNPENPITFMIYMAVAALAVWLFTGSLPDRAPGTKVPDELPAEQKHADKDQKPQARG